MRPYAKAVLVVALAAVTACGSQIGTGERPCTAIGARQGVGLRIEPPYARRVAGAEMKVCWNGRCRTVETRLEPATAALPGKCPDGGPDTACGATMSPTGGKTGFADVPDLPKAPVQVTLVLRDGTGKPILDERLDVTPRGTFPNGPHCGEGAPQANLTVTDGRVTSRA